MQLILLRHGIAEECRPGLDDADRDLTPLGIERTRQAVQGLVTYLGRIDAVLTSPKRRARETAALLCAVIGLSPEACAPLGEGTIDHVLIELSKRDESVLVLVGHEPQLSMMAQRLCGAVQVSFIELKKAGAIVMRVGSLNPHAPTAVIEALLPPKVLRGLRANE